jgi:hypothetical protein
MRGGKKPPAKSERGRNLLVTTRLASAPTQHSQATELCEETEYDDHRARGNVSRTRWPEDTRVDGGANAASCFT